MFKTLLSILYSINLALIDEFNLKIFISFSKERQFLSPKKNELDKKFKLITLL
jgi:hypothetical protein